MDRLTQQTLVREWCKRAKSGTGTVSSLARDLGVSRNTIYRRLQELKEAGVVLPPLTNKLDSSVLQDLINELMG